MSIIDKFVIRRFHKLLYRSPKVRHHSSWFGVRIIKFPTDFFFYQEIVFRTRPDIIIETGTKHGGTSLFLAHLLGLIGNGKVITIDTVSENVTAAHPRMTFFQGSSVDESVINEVRKQISPNDKVMVVLDSDHRAKHVLSELKIYAPLVTRDCYLIVEDTNKGTLDEPDFGPGPKEALNAFLKEDSSFEVDEEIEGFLVSMHHGGYLRKIK